MNTTRFAFFLLLSTTAFAQDEDLIRIKPGQSIIKDFPKNKRYRYPAYLPGRVHYYSGKQSEVFSFNYDLLLGSLRGISQFGDTVFIGDDKRCEYITIGDDVFYRSPAGYLEVIANHDSTFLAVREEYDVKRFDKQASDGYSSGPNMTGAVSVQKKEILIGKRTEFFLRDRSGGFHKATRARFEKLFTAQRGLIEAFIRTNTISFQKVEDLKKVFYYCASLNNELK